MKPVSEVKLMDCMDYMRGFPDKFFELAVVDPDFGLGDKIADGGTWAENASRSSLKIKTNDRT